LGAWAYLPVQVTAFLAYCSVTLCHKQGCGTNKKGVGAHPKILAIWNSFELILNKNMKKV